MNSAAEAPPGPAADPLPAGAAAVLSVLPGASVVVDPAGRAVWATRDAAGLGLVRSGRLLDHALRAAVRTVHRTGASRSLVLQSQRRRSPQRVELAVQVARLTPDLMLVLAEDRSHARRVDDVRRDFVANVSHELKTPVGALSLLAEAVADAADDPQEVARFADRMQVEAQRLTQLVTELIELSRLQGDDPLPRGSTVQVDDVVAGAVDAVHTAASAQHIDLRLAGTPGLEVFGDAEQLTTALRNLLVNAVSYSPPRTQVVVTRQATDDAVEVSVSDRGIGIPAADLQRVFERFYRVDPARSRATGGTGLGLAIVKHVVENHGGEVSVWSVAGTGSTFTLRLPGREAGRGVR